MSASPAVPVPVAPSADRPGLAEDAQPRNTTATPARRMRTRTRNRIELTLIYMTLLLWVAVSLAPVVWAILQSIKLPPDIFAIPPKWIFHATLVNFRTLFSQTGSAFIRYLLISLAVTVGTVVITLVASLPAAYTLTFLPVRRRIWPVILLLAAMLPPIVLVVPLFLFWQNLGMIDNPMALILTYSAVNVPFSVWLIRGFMLQVPMALVDAGRLDGAGDIRLLVSVVVPVVRAGIASAAVFLVIFAWNELLFATILTTSNRTAPAGIVATLITDRAMDWGVLYAAGTLVIVPIMLFTFAVRKHFVRGFTFGAVKG